MILEQAVFAITDGNAKDFEIAYSHARSYIESAAGFQKLEMRPCVEIENRYLLLVWWDSIEAHTKGFRESAGFTEWRIAEPLFREPARDAPLPGAALAAAPALLYVLRGFGLLSVV